MNRLLALTLSVFMLALGGANDAWASGDYHGHGGHHGHYGHHSYHGHHGGHFRSSFGIFLGDPFWWGPRPYYRPYPLPYYQPQTIVIEREPPVYVQRQPPALWYYCPSPAGYYPYVQNCAQQWVSVDPQSVPPGPAR